VTGRTNVAAAFFVIVHNLARRPTAFPAVCTAAMEVRPGIDYQSDAELRELVHHVNYGIATDMRETGAHPM
jgi:hypothetical protein